MNDAEVRIAVMEDSLRCFVCGWLGLVPVLGLIPAVMAVRAWGRVREAGVGRVNPARGYLRAGIWLARAGMVISVGLLFGVALVVGLSLG